MLDSVRNGRHSLDDLRFFFQWLRNPGQLGAAVPSGHALAATLARQIDAAAPGAVVELGPGTGSVTRAILAAGIRPEELVVIERAASFCAMLQARFPGLRVVEGDARDVEALVDESGVGPAKAVVSGLPLLNFPHEERRRVLAQAFSVLRADGVLLQYTYGPGSPVPQALCAELGLEGERVRWVLANLPPAAVWCYRRGREARGLRRAA